MSLIFSRHSFTRLGRARQRTSAWWTSCQSHVVPYTIQEEVKAEVFAVGILNVFMFVFLFSRVRLCCVRVRY